MIKAEMKSICRSSRDRQSLVDDNNNNCSDNNSNYVDNDVYKGNSEFGRHKPYGSLTTGTTKNLAVATAATTDADISTTWATINNNRRKQKRPHKTLETGEPIMT